MDARMNDRKGQEKAGIGGKYEGALSIILRGIAYLAVGFIAGRTVLPFGVYPIGIALLCGSGEYTLAVLGGLLLSLVGVNEWYLYLGAYLLALSLRVLMLIPSRTSSSSATGLLGAMSEQSWWQRALCAAVAAFALSLYGIVKGGFLYYDVIGALLSVCVAAVCSALWGVAFRRRTLSQLLCDLVGVVAYLSMCYFAVYSLREYAFYGVETAVFAAMLITLYTTKISGALKGTLAAIAGGLAVSVSFAPSFVFGAVCYAYLAPVSSLLGCFSAFAAGISWGVYIEGISAFSSLFAALMASTVLFFVGERLFLSENQREAIGDTGRETLRKSSAISEGFADAAVVRFDDVARRMKELCEGLSAISDVLLNEKAEGCSEASNESASSSFSACIDGSEIRLKRNGRRKNGTPREGKERVICSDEFISDVRERHCGDEERTRVFALELRAISDYLANIMLENDREFFPDVALCKKLSVELSELLSDNGMTVSAFGGRKKRILVSSTSERQLTANKDRIKRKIEGSSGVLLDVGETLEFGDRAYLSFAQRSALKADMAGGRRNAVGEEEYCGDSFGLLEGSGDGVAFAYISDGMGSGKAAAEASEVCSMFLEKLLRVSEYNADAVCKTVEIINGFMKSKTEQSSRECSATVDLGVFDLIEHRAVFYKSGAAPTYVFRDGYLFKVRSRTLPIGIVDEPDIGKINIELLPGDVIIMLSDGISGGREEYSELFDFLRSRLLTHSPAELVEALLDFAEQSGSEDDLSAVVVKIDEGVFDR